MREVRVDLLTGRMVCDPAGRRVGRIRELVGEVARAGSGEYVVREFHLSTGGLVEALGGSQLARVLAERLGRRTNRIVVGWRDLDLSDPERPRLRCPVAELPASAAER
ncbi:MAG TPA: hypothetical protein VG432_11740 [Gemmatimonadaceae bacterium]|nr:hypothetical protein [Gemmatimonadaceae bacterium]